MLIIVSVNRKRLGTWEVKYNLLTNKYVRQTAAIGFNYRGITRVRIFFLHRLNPGRIAVQKNRQLVTRRCQKKLKKRARNPGSLNSARV